MLVFLKNVRKRFKEWHFWRVELLWQKIIKKSKKEDENSSHIFVFGGEKKLPFFSTRRRVRNENLTSLRGGARMLKSCQLLRLEKTLQNSRISCQNRAKAGWWWAWYTYFFTSLVKRLMMFCWQNIFYKIWTRFYGFQKT